LGYRHSDGLLDDANAQHALKMCISGLFRVSPRLRAERSIPAGSGCTSADGCDAQFAPQAGFTFQTATARIWTAKTAFSRGGIETN
jgi:hypothetical protein